MRYLQWLSCAMLMLTLAACSLGREKINRIGDIATDAQNESYAHIVANLVAQSDTFHEEFVEQGLLVEGELYQHLSRMVDYILGQSYQDAISVKVFLLRDPNPNAFATPAGRIYVTAGLLSAIDNNCTLEVILEHEIAHYARQHALKSYLNQQRLMVPAEIVDTLLAGTALSFLPAGLSVMKYSRELESEADDIAIRHIQSRRMLSEDSTLFFKRLNQIIPASLETSVWDSHPSNEQRIKKFLAVSDQNTCQGFVMEPPYSDSLRRQAISMSIRTALMQRRPVLALRLLELQSEKTLVDPLLAAEVYRSVLLYKMAYINEMKLLNDINRSAAQKEYERLSAAYREHMIAFYNEAIEEGKQSRQALQRLGMFYAHSGEKQEAEVIYKRLLKEYQFDDCRLKQAVKLGGEK